MTDDDVDFVVILSSCRLPILFLRWWPTDRQYSDNIECSNAVMRLSVIIPSNVTINGKVDVYQLSSLGQIRTRLGSLRLSTSRSFDSPNAMPWQNDSCTGVNGSVGALAETYRDIPRPVFPIREVLGWVPRFLGDSWYSGQHAESAVDTAHRQRIRSNCRPMHVSQWQHGRRCPVQLSISIYLNEQRSQKCRYTRTKLVPRGVREGFNNIHSL